jgi:predicted transcriptional regulator
MPVNETLSLCEALEREDLAVDLIVLNALYPIRFDAAETEQLADALDRTSSTLPRSALRAALAEHARATTQREQEARLKAGVNGRLVELPYVFTDQIGLPELQTLADALGLALRGRRR